jgi:hypothetical protein
VVAVFHGLGEAGGVEFAGGSVDVGAYVALEELGGFFAEGYAGEEDGDARLSGGVGLEVDVR